ncbi:MAG: hypothetical protein QE280_07485 [Caulobacter sp.]|nr:hypothetical protein [Caulobacter sp.]
MNGSIWDRLGLERTRETRAVRRAYAARLKITNPEDDAAGFQALREAYEAALRYCETGFDLSGVRFYYESGPDDDDQDDDGDDPGALPDRPENAGAEPSPTGPLAGQADHPGASPAANPDARASQDPGPVENRPDHQAALAASRQRLLALLRAEPAASSSALALALEDMMSQPALQGLDSRSDWEFWLARTIRQEAPRSDPLIHLAVDALKWRRHGDGALGRAVDAAFDRRDALEFLRDLRLKRHPRHVAFLALSGPPPRSVLSYLFRPSPLGDLPGLILRLEEDFPSLQEDFPHLEAWQAWLEVPRLSPAALWAAILAVPVSALACLFLAPGASPLTDLGLALSGGLAVLGLAFAWLYGIQTPRRRWRESWQWRAPAFVEHGWAPAGGALILLAAALPVSPWSLLLLAIPGLGLSAWAAIVGEMDRREDDTSWWVRMLRANAYYLIWIALLAWRGPPAVHVMAPALLTGAVLSALGSQSLLDFWCTRLGPVARRAGASALLTLVGLAGALLFLNGPEPEGPIQGLVIALVAIAVLAARPLAETLNTGPLTARHWIGWLGLIILGNLLSSGTPYDLALACGWILVGPTIVGAAALMDAMAESRRS